MRFSFFPSGFILIVCTAGVLLAGMLIFGVWSGQRRLVRFYSRSKNSEIRRMSIVKNTVSAVLIVSAFTMMAAALFGPEWGEEKRERTYSGRDIMFCIDISNSMKARDVGIERLELAKLFVQNVIASTDRSNFGVTIFKGGGVVALPLTADTAAVNKFVDKLNPGYSTVPGTNVEKGLKAAASGFSRERPGKKYIFLLSDGEGLEGDPLRSDAVHTLQGIEVWTFLTGTAAGAVIPGREKKNILTAADPELLAAIAERYNGRFFHLAEQNWWQDFSSAFRQMPASDGGYESGYEIVPVPRYPLFIGTAVVFSLMYILIRALIWKETL